jgi:uncharacterized Zn finger protein
VDVADGMRILQDCPTCGYGDVPYLVVRSSSTQNNGGVSWRCRRCQTEWSDASSDVPQASLEAQQVQGQSSAGDRRDA